MFPIYCRKLATVISLSWFMVFALWAQTAAAIDFIAPRIEHSAETVEIEPGDDHLVTASVTDDARVEAVILHYREQGQKDFIPLSMQNLDGSDNYEVKIVSSAESAGLEYFFEGWHARVPV